MNVITLTIPTLIFAIYYLAVTIAEVVNNKGFPNLKRFPKKIILASSLVLVPFSYVAYNGYGIKLDMYLLVYSIGVISLTLITINILNGGKVRICFTVVFQFMVVVMFAKARVRLALIDYLCYLSLAEVTVGIVSCIK